MNLSLSCFVTLRKKLPFFQMRKHNPVQQPSLLEPHAFPRRLQTTPGNEHFGSITQGKKKKRKKNTCKMNAPLVHTSFKEEGKEGPKPRGTHLKKKPK